MFLEKKQYKSSTKRTYKRYIQQFLSWFEIKNKSVLEVKYQDILEFIKSRKERKESTRFINSQLGVLRMYFDFLELQNNPASDLILNGNTRKLPQNLLSEKQLNQLYFDWKESSEEKELLGFLVFQGLKMGEIKRLEIKDIDFQKGIVFIKGTSRTNTRKLLLQGVQTMNLYKFIFQLKEEKSLFLFHQNTFSALSQRLNKRLKSGFQTNSLTIRSSVICNWLKQFNLREVQYKSGHKYVSSTEKYQQVNVQDLQEAVMRFHPI